MEREKPYSQGIASDGPVILFQGEPMTPEDIVEELNNMTYLILKYQHLVIDIKQSLRINVNA